MSGEVQIRPAEPEDAAAVLAVITAAFLSRPRLDPPADALGETEDSIRRRLERGGGLLATVDGAPVGTVLFDPEEETLYLRRFGVSPDLQHRGIAQQLARAALAAAPGIDGVDRIAVLARQELPSTLRFWRRQGFGEVYADPPYLEMARALPHRVEVPTPDDMRGLAKRLAEVLRAGDVLVLNGDLGAGKTTFTQGLGEALGVRGDVTSPTFVIARVHPSLADGPALVHVDAYRLHDGAELDDLDLDASLDEAVTVVEWGGGLAEALSDAPLEIRIHRSSGDVDGDDPRTVEIDPYGARWLGVDLPVL